MKSMTWQWRMRKMICKGKKKKKKINCLRPHLVACDLILKKAPPSRKNNQPEREGVTEEVSIICSVHVSTARAVTLSFKMCWSYGGMPPPENYKISITLHETPKTVCSTVNIALSNRTMNFQHLTLISHLWKCLTNLDLPRTEICEKISMKLTKLWQRRFRPDTSSIFKCCLTWGTPFIRFIYFLSNIFMYI